MFRNHQMKVRLMASVITMALILQCTALAVFAEELPVYEETQTVETEEGLSEQTEEEELTEESVSDTQESAAVEEEAADQEESAAAEEPAADQEESAAAEEPAADQEESVPAEEPAVDQEESASAEEAAQKEAALVGETAVLKESEAVPEETAPAVAVFQKAEGEAAGGEDPEGETSPVAEGENTQEEAALVGESAQTQKSESAYKAVFYYRSKEDNADIPDTYVYDDSLLKGNSLDYNAELATMSLSLVNASISSTRGAYGEEGDNSKSRNLRAYLEDNGFEDFKANEDYSLGPTLDTTGIACAHKKIVDNGKEYTTLVIAPRSAGYKAEWGRNFSLGESGDHQGFTAAKEKVLAFVREYIKETGIQGDIKVWIAGGSRGAGIVNLTGAELLRDSNAALGDAVNLTPENLYCYTFGTPHTADVTSDEYINNKEKYAYIHNLSETNDIVGTFPPSAMNFDRYGTTTGYVDPDKKEDMLLHLKAISEKLYTKFITGGDPDMFRALDLNYEEMLNKKLSFVPAAEGTYLYGMDQAEFLDALESSMMEVFKDRTKYTEGNYQEALEHFFGYVYGKSGELGTLFGGVRKSKFAIPVAAGLFISTTLERNLDNDVSYEETIENLQQTITDLDAAMEELKSQDIPLDEELEKEYTALKSELEKAKKSKKIEQSLVNLCWQITSAFYSRAMEEGLANVNSLNEAEKAALTSKKDSQAMSRALGYLLMADDRQDTSSPVRQVGQQISHLATVIGNAKSFMTPHYNEVLLAWLRAQDANYQDFQKADSGQATGYRRVFVEQPNGVDVVGTIKNSAGEVVAVFKNGEMVSKENAWIGLTTSDSGNWLRLPIDDTYTIDFVTSADTSLNLKVSEYSTESAKEVRVETGDSKYSWKDFNIRPVDSATLVVSAIDSQDGVYTLNTGSAYYLDLLKRFFITFELAGGNLNGNTTAVTSLYDNGTILTLPTPVREGYRFAYWEGSRYNAGDQYTVSADHIFKAIWEALQPEKPVPSDSEKQEEKGNSAAPDKKESGAAEITVSSEKPSSARESSAEVRRVAAVQTGDETSAAFWLMLMVISMFCAAGVALKRNRQY